MSVTDNGKSSDTFNQALRDNQANGEALPGSDGEGDDDVDHPGWMDLIRSKLGMDASRSVREKLIDELNDDAATKGVFTAQERDMLNRILRIGNLRVEDVMVPRADIVAIDDQSEIADLLKLFRNAGHSRIPVFRDTLDDARGMIHIKDLLSWLMGGKNGDLQKPANGNGSGNASSNNNADGDEDDEGALPISAEKSERLRSATSIDDTEFFTQDLTKPIMSARIRRPVLFVPPSMPAMNLFLRMQSTRIHMALVVDEYGGTDGLISIEDLVEEVVGEIEDEHDDQNTDLIVEDPVRGLIASARAPVEEFEKLIGIDLMPDEDDEDIDTLGGLVFSLVGRVPVCGELVPHPKGIEFEVLEANSRQIKRLKIHRNKLLLENTSAGVKGNDTASSARNDIEDVKANVKDVTAHKKPSQEP